jgi:hypothetical protein
MRGLSKKAKSIIDAICAEMGVRPVWVVNAVFEALSREQVAAMAGSASQPKPARKPRPAQYARRQAPGTRAPRSTKYGFENMMLNKRYRIECGADTSLDMPQQAARIYAAKRGIRYGYERLTAERVVVVWFYDPENPQGYGGQLSEFDRIAASVAAGHD